MSTELDAQVAVEIIGWEQVGDGSQWRAPDHTYHWHLPAYSTDWAAFGELWEHLQADPSIDLMKVIYVSDEHEARVNDSYGHGTFHEAFCHAALAAVRARKENQDDG